MVNYRPKAQSDTDFRSIEESFRGRKVLVTGHTGFKGSWLTHWLLKLDAQVHGYALNPMPHERLYDELDLSNRIASDTRADIRDLDRVCEIVCKLEPDIIFHLAAQPLVRRGYAFPTDTFSINVMGTLNVLESLRKLRGQCACVIVTSDKCYRNHGREIAYKEDDPLGGDDPYSASKAAAEIVTASYRAAYFDNDQHIRVATARAGNVVGGGDWSEDRIVPDIFRALRNGQPINVRNPNSTRPWQHVLEPLAGYLTLASRLLVEDFSDRSIRSTYCSAFNFGPAQSNRRTVADLVDQILTHIEGSWNSIDATDVKCEAVKLDIAIDKAIGVLKWHPRWSFEETILKTVEFYVDADKLGPIKLVDQQIEQYSLRFETFASASDRQSLVRDRSRV